MSNRSLGVREVISAAWPQVGDRDHDEVVAERIAGRVLDATIRHGRFDHVVHGGYFGVLPTLHEPEVYAAVADQLEEEAELEIVAKRFQVITPTLMGVEGFIPTSVVERYDKISILSLAGTAIERTPQSQGRAQFMGQVYPPLDVSGMRNLSLGHPNLN